MSHVRMTPITGSPRPGAARPSRARPPGSSRSPRPRSPTSTARWPPRKASGLRLEEIQREHFPLTVMRATARAGGDRDVRRPRVRGAARAAGAPLPRRRRRPHLLGLRPLHGRAALPEPPGRAARPRLRPRPDLRQHRRARLRDQRLPAVSHGRGRHGGAALPAPGPRGRAQQHRELGDGAQRDPGPAPRVPRPALQRLLLYPPRGGPDRARRLRASDPGVRPPGRRGELPLHPQPDQRGRGEARGAADHASSRPRSTSSTSRPAAPDLRLDMDLQPGDIQFINNYTILHSRTGFVDGPEPRPEAPHAAALAQVPEAVAAEPRVPDAHGLQARTRTRPSLVEAET